MGAVSLGPLVFSADRFAAILGLAVFFIAATILARKVDPRFNTWSWRTFVAALIAGRLGHVALYWQNFSAEPLRVFALWEGGFFWPPAAAAVILMMLFGLKTTSLRLWAAAPLAAALMTANIAWQLTGTTPATPLPERAFKTLAGPVHDFTRPTGRPMVINLWASWCPPCRREMPMMAEVAGEVEGVDFIFANQGEDGGTVNGYLAGEGLTLRTVLIDGFSDLSRHYGAPGLPATLFIGADGKVRGTHLGEISREIFQSNIQRLTAAQ